MNQQDALEHATRLHERVRLHKRAERHHRRTAQLTMQELERFCAEHRINLITTQTGRSQSHGSERAA